MLKPGADLLRFSLGCTSRPKGRSEFGSSAGPASRSIYLMVFVIDRVRRFDGTFLECSGASW